MNIVRRSLFSAIAGLFLLLIPVAPVLCLPLGWEQAEGPIFLRVQLGKEARQPIYVAGTCSWYWPRKTSGFTLLKSDAPASAPAKEEQFIQPGAFSRWVEIDAVSLGAAWTNRITLNYPGKLPAQDNTLTVEVASQPNEKAVVKRLQILLGPSQTTLPMLLHRRLEGEVIRPFADLAEETYRQAVKQTREMKFGRRPSKFICTTNMPLRKDAAPQAWDKELQTLALLGFNGINWQQGPELEKRGFTRNGLQSFYWPSFPSEEAVEGFVKKQADRVTAAEGWNGLAMMSMFEECGGPSLEDMIAGDKSHDAAFYRERFCDYLKSRGLKPQDLGKKDWNEVRLVTRGEAYKEPFLFYHSARFRPWVLTNSIRMVDSYMPKYFPNPLLTSTFTSDAYVGSGSMARHGVDLFHWIREAPGVMDQASEGWKNGAATYQITSWEMEVMRAATRYKKAPGLGLLNIIEWGRTGTDISFNAYSALAHGLNYMIYFAWGPWYVGGDCASHKEHIFPALRRTNYAIGQVEDLLLETYVRPAKTAILYSMAADAWNWAKYDSNNLMLSDNIGIFLSLIHDQIPVDLLAEEDITRGELDKYETLYIVGPHIERAAAARIRDWVARGGTLAGTAGAGSRDEYDRPLKTLEEVFGAVQSEPNIAKSPGGSELHNLPELDNVIGQGFYFEAAGAKIAVKTVGSSPKVLARYFSDDTPAVIGNVYGKGRSLLFAGLPGVAYLREALKLKDRNRNAYVDCYSPGEYPRNIRDIINRPAVERKAVRPVEIDVPVVEAGLREGEKGAVVVLVNYPRRPLKGLKIGVKGLKADRIRDVVSTSLGKSVAFKRLNDKDIELELPLLEEVDMIGIYYR